MRNACLVAMLAAAVVGACSRAPDESRPATPAQAPAARAAQLPPDMVSAVSGSKASSAVDLKFLLRSRPEPGRPLDIDLAVIPKDSQANIRLIVQNTDGFEITAGQQVSIPKGVEQGVAVVHRLTVVPARDGVFSLSAVALVDTDKTSVTRTFAIPVIVGEGITATGLAPDSAAATDSP